jgi:hypothetical protein
MSICIFDWDAGFHTITFNPKYYLGVRTCEIAKRVILPPSPQLKGFSADIEIKATSGNHSENPP